MRITKVEPLRCPQCKSERVKRGFTKRIKNAFVGDNKIWCYECMSVTDKTTGKVQKHEYRTV